MISHSSSSSENSCLKLRENVSNIILHFFKYSNFPDILWHYDSFEIQVIIKKSFLKVFFQHQVRHDMDRRVGLHVQTEGEVEAGEDVGYHDHLTLRVT